MSSEETQPETSASSSTSPPNDEYQWELYRENVKPLRTGRRVEAINQALSSTATVNAPCASQMVKDKFDETLATCSDHPDPLVPCLDFIKWFDETFPVGRQRLFYEYLWKIVNAHAKESRYIEDERMLKVWEKLADSSLGNGWSIFQHANAIGSLTRSALFYAEWAKYFEAAGSITEARKVFRRARNAGAVPITVINNEENEMEMREMRRELASRHDDSWEVDEDEDMDENGQRVALTRLQGMGAHLTAPVVRLPELVGDGGSSRLLRDNNGDTVHQNNGSCGFNVYVEDDPDADDAENRNILESVYDMRTHVEEHVSLTENAKRREAMGTALPLKQRVNPPCAFTIYEEGVENEEGAEGQKKRPKLMLRKELRGGMSIEEALAERYDVTPTDSASEKSMSAITEKVARKLRFD